MGAMPVEVPVIGAIPVADAGDEPPPGSASSTTPAPIAKPQTSMTSQRDRMASSDLSRSPCAAVSVMRAHTAWVRGHQWRDAEAALPLNDPRPRRAAVRRTRTAPPPALFFDARDALDIARRTRLIDGLNAADTTVFRQLRKTAAELSQDRSRLLGLEHAEDGAAGRLESEARTLEAALARAQQRQEE